MVYYTSMQLSSRPDRINAPLRLVFLWPLPLVSCLRNAIKKTNLDRFSHVV